MEMPNINDEELVRRFYQADEEALAVIFKRHKDGVFNFALRLTANRADAEDAVSHAFMMVCEKRYSAKEGAGFKTWLYTVVHHHCISKLRGRNKFYSLWFSKNDPEDEVALDVVDPKANAREGMDQKEIAGLIQKAIHRLPEEQKEALLLREYQGFTYEEIAQVLNCSKDKVKVLIFRARNFLKEVLPPVLLQEGR